MHDSGLEDRYGMGWSAATLMLQGDVDEALDVLDTAAGPAPEDDWSLRLRAGCTELRHAESEIRQAERLGRDGRASEARWHWRAAFSAWETACHVMDGLGDQPLRMHLPDPWPQILELFKDHMDDRRQESELAQRAQDDGTSPLDRAP